MSALRDLVSLVYSDPGLDLQSTRTAIHAIVASFLSLRRCCPAGMMQSLAMGMGMGMVPRHTWNENAVFRQCLLTSIKLLMLRVLSIDDEDVISGRQLHHAATDIEVWQRFQNTVLQSLDAVLKSCVCIATHTSLSVCMRSQANQELGETLELMCKLSQLPSLRSLNENCIVFALSCILRRLPCFQPRVLQRVLTLARSVLPFMSVPKTTRLFPHELPHFLIDLIAQYTAMPKPWSTPPTPPQPGHSPPIVSRALNAQEYGVALHWVPDLGLNSWSQFFHTLHSELIAKLPVQSVDLPATAASRRRVNPALALDAFTRRSKLREGPDTISLMEIGGGEVAQDIADNVSSSSSSSPSPSLSMGSSAIHGAHDHSRAAAPLSGTRVTAKNGFATLIANVSVCGGCWYYELHLQSEGVMQVGWASNAFSPNSNSGNGVGDDASSWAYDGHRIAKWHQSQVRYGKRRWEKGDVVGVALDLDHGKMRFFLNGDDLGVAYANLVCQAMRPACSFANGECATFVFQPEHFHYEAPASHFPLQGDTPFTAESPWCLARVLQKELKEHGRLVVCEDNQ